MRALVIVLTLALLSGCQQPDKTRVYRKGSQDFSALSKSFSRSLRSRITVDENTVLLDARNAFEFGGSHAEGSHNVQWDSFSQRNHKGLLNKNLNRISRRLSLLGINQDTPVVVLGNGQEGAGEEARVAWMLMYLGVKNVQTASLDSLKLRRAKAEGPGPENVERWKPEPITHLLADVQEVMGNAVGKKDKNIHVIDVRSQKEYFEKDQVELRGLNIEWKEFFTSKGRPNLQIKKRLQNIGINPKDRIVIMSDEGLRSGAVTYALTMMGFQNVGNLAVGWKALK